MLPNRQPLVWLGWPPTRLQLGDIVRRGSPAPSIAENHHMRAELRRQAAVVAEARCARRDATHNDALLSTSYGFTHVLAPSES